MIESSFMEEDLPISLDPVQLRKIESVHQGFLYQHLYAVGCLLLAGSNSSNQIRVELDEDVEVHFPDSTVYIQIKTRASKLYDSDINTALDRFKEIRSIHKKEERKGNALYLIISNVPISATLAANYAKADWPSDVLILFPGGSTKPPFTLPPPWETLNTAISWCVEKAETLPFRLINSQSLVWKLAAVVQYSSTGQGSKPHTFNTDLLHELFEQVVIQIQSFPPEPSTYREHVDEPAYITNSVARLIIGHSGSGKSVWASRLAAHSPDTTVYFDAALVEGSAVISSLARELIAKLSILMGRTPRGLLFPGASGLETLSVLNSYAAKNNFSPVVVFDNAHIISPELLVRTKEVTSAFKWIFICQPSTNQVELETLLNLPSEHIQPWSLTSVAEEFKDSGCHLTPQEAQNVIDLTGGVPLFVKNVATICNKDYSGDIKKTLRDIEGDLTLSKTAQEIIANRVYASLSSRAKEVASIMSLSPLPHSKEDLTALLKGLAGNEGKELEPIRVLISAGIVQAKAGGGIGIHDSFRILCARHLEAIEPTKVETALTRFRDIYGPPWAQPTFDRIGPYFKILARLNEYKTIINLGTSFGELFFEVGLVPMMRELLHQALGQTSEAEDLFYILDTLCFWSIQDGNFPEARRLISEMAKILESDNLGPKEAATFFLKRMSLEGRENLKEAKKYYQAALDLRSDSLMTLILRYNYASLLWRHQQYQEAAKECTEIALEYFDRVGLDPLDIVGKNPPDIFAMLDGREYDISDLKRLADSLDLFGMCCFAQRKPSGLARMHAFKLYTMTYAIRSAIKVGMDVVDEFIGLLRDAEGAKKFIETVLLPTLNDYQILDYLLPVRAQYAVVMAYCGDFVAARGELKKLAPFLESAGPDIVNEVNNQAALINAIEAGEVSLGVAPQQEKVITRRLAREERRIGRNAPCTCGSGKKYKKCCGR